MLDAVIDYSLKFEGNRGHLQILQTLSIQTHAGRVGAGLGVGPCRGHPRPRQGWGWYGSVTMQGSRQTQAGMGLVWEWDHAETGRDGVGT